MISIKELLNKLKWDDRFSIDDYTIFYHDRIKDEDIAIDCKDIKDIEGSFLLIERDGEDVPIPLHRIRKLMKNNMTVWRR